jgi:NSS family neurotransmitter:Na+ symporter
MNASGDKNTWNSQAGFIWAMIGSAVGFANILGFSSKAYFHGGGAFLVPFMVALLVLGLPLLYLEGIIGQHFQLPLVSAYGKTAGKLGKVFGWLSILAVGTIGAFYVVLTGWSIAYTYFTAANVVTENSALFFTQDFLHMSSGITSLGSFAGMAFLFTVGVMLFSWYVLVRDIQSGVEALCSIFLPLLAVIVCLCALAVCFLPGAWMGFGYYLSPDFSKLADPRLWLDAFGHLFFSLSLGLGIVTGYARHAGESIDIKRSMFWVIVGDFLISLIAGFAIFGCVGYMSQLQGIPFTELVKPNSNFEMGFIVFPQILKTFGSFVYRVIGPVFFFSVFIAGVTGVFSIIESIAGNIEVEFGTSRSYAVSVTSAFMGVCSILFCMGNGLYVIGALEPMVTGFNMIIGGFAEVVFFMYGSVAIAQHTIWKNSQGQHTFSYHVLRTLNLLLLAVIFLSACVNEYQTGFSYPEMVRWGWFVLALALSIGLSLKSQCNRSAQ